MSHRSVALRAERPSLVDRRGDRHLLVFGEAGQWLLVDSELRALVEALARPRSMAEVLREHAARFGKPLDVVRREAPPILGELAGRGLLRRSDGASSRQERDEPLRLANVTINVTNRCNLRCAFCYNEGERRARPEAPVEPVMDALAASSRLLEPDASFIVLGGEPLMVPDRLFAMLARAEQLFRTPTLVSTNGTALTASMVERLAARRVEVQVSIDSARGGVHDASRGAGVHAKAVEGARRLVRAGVPTILSMVYTRATQGELEAYLDLTLEVGAQEARFIPLRAIGGGRAQASSLPDQAAALETLLGILERRPEVRRLLGRDYFSIAKIACERSLRRSSCGIGRRVVFVDADGLVYPCPNHTGPEHCAGDVRREGLAAILAGPVFEQVRARYQVSSYPRCRACAFRRWCAGDCRGEVLALTGDPEGPSPHCEELQKMFTRLMWIAADGGAPFGGGARAREEPFLF